MKLTGKGWLRAAMRVGVCAVMVCALGWLGWPAAAQAVSTTTVQGTVYLANGQPGAGTLVVSWPSFTTAAGQEVAADKITVTIPADGFVSVNLAPNQGATPAGEFYTAVFYMSDGTTNTEYWVVPAAAQASLAQVESQVMPAAQAVQAVSKAYVDQAVAQALGSELSVSGGNLTGPLYLSGDPTQPLQASDKHYVDQAVAQAVPLAGGNMTGALTTPTVNGVQAPATGSAQTTLQAAVDAAGTNGAVEIPPTYAGTDTFTNANGVRVTDLRTIGAQQTARSVKEFGAACDGVTDDTNALQAAIDYAHTHNVALTIPQGVCKTRPLDWHGESIGGISEQASALMGFPGQDVLASMPDSTTLMANTRIHDLTIYVDQSVDTSCSPAEGRAAGGNCEYSRPIENNSIFSTGGNGQTNTAGTGAGWWVGNCAISMPATTGAGGNGLVNATIENVKIVATGTDPMAAQYPGAHSTHTCGIYLAQWPQSSDFRNIDIQGLNTGIAIPALPVATPSGLTADSNRWQNITVQATHAFTAAAGSNNVLDNVTAMAGNSAAMAEPPTGIVLDLPTGLQGWTVRNAVVQPTWDAVQPQLTVAVSNGAVTGVTVGPEDGLGFDPYGTQVPLSFSSGCTAQATASVNNDGSIGSVSVTQGGSGCSSTTTASVNEPGTWDTAAPVNLIGGQNISVFAGNLLKGNGGYTVWDATGSQSYGTQLAGGGGNLPGGGSYLGLIASSAMGSTYKVDQFPGADFGAKLQACLNAMNPTYGGTCDARNFTGTLSMGANLTIATSNTTIDLPCATIATANQVIVTAGTRNVALHGCALRGGSAANGNQGGTVFEYSGAGAVIQVGDSTYAVNTPGFHMDNAVISTTNSTSATAEGLTAYRTQEMDLDSLYFLGNSNQTGMTLDGTGNYTGGTYFDNSFNGFGTAINAVGHEISNPATTDWLNASTFLRLHIDCPTSGGSPIAGTVGINLLQGDGNTFTGGDVEGCATALHLGPNAQNNTIIGLRNENSTQQVVADAGSSYNDWITGGTMYTGQLTDNGTRNSFLDTFHRSFNGMNGDWYGSQQDATVTNHFRLGIGAGNERGLLKRYQTDYGYRWTTGLSDATAGEQFYEIEDELNNVYRLSIGQYNHGQSSTNDQTVLNAAGTGAIVLNGSTNAGTGGVVIGSGGTNASTVATISSAGNAQFNGTLQVGGSSTFSGSTTVKNQADAEIDSTLWAGLTTPQKESFIYKDWNGNSQWYMVKDASNNWALNSATGGLDSFKAYQSNNSGDTYINTSNTTGHIRLNYETGSGAETDIYSGSSSSLDAAFLGPTSIKFPGLAASSGTDCLQIDSSGYVSNTGAACGSGSSGTINSGSSGQIAYYTANGSVLGGVSTVPVSAGGTGASTASAALASLLPGAASDGSNGLTIAGNVTPNASITKTSPVYDIRAYGAVIDGATDIESALQAAWNAMPSSGGTVLLPCTGSGCYWANPTTFNWGSHPGTIILQGNLTVGTTLALPLNLAVNLIGQDGAAINPQFVSPGQQASVSAPSTTGTLGTAVSTTPGTSDAVTFTPSTMTGLYAGTVITVAGPTTCTITSLTRTNNFVTAQLSSSCHIPPGVPITVAGVTDTSFNGSYSGGYQPFIVTNSDYVNNTISWGQTAANGSSTGGTVTGLNEDTVEDVPITSCTTTTCTATFYRSHAATDTFGIVGVYMNGNTHAQMLKNINVSASGSAIVDDSYESELDHVGFNQGGACSGNYANFGLSIMGGSYIHVDNSSLGAACQPYSVRVWNQWNYGYASAGPLYITNSFLWRGVKEDFGGVGVSITNSTCDQCSRGAITFDPSYFWNGNPNENTILNLQFNDNPAGFNNSVFYQTVPYNLASSPGGSASVFIRKIWGSVYANVNEYFDGKISTDKTAPFDISKSRGVYGTINNGQQLIGEVRDSGANLSPALIPYQTANIPQTPSSWTGYCTVTSGVTGPDGTATAGSLVYNTNNYSVAGQVNETPAVGDMVLFGAWVYTPTQGYDDIPTSTSAAVSLDNASSAHFAFNYGSTGGFSIVNGTDLGLIDDWWHPVVGLATVTASDGTSGQVRLRLSCDSTRTMEYWNPWMIYIPASAGVSLAEANRWRADLLHAYVGPNMAAGTLSTDPNLKLYLGNNTANLYAGTNGSVKTDQAIDAVNGYKCNGAYGANGTYLQSTGSGCTWSTVSASIPDVPSWLLWQGDGSDGAFSCTSGTCAMRGDNWYTSVNIAAGATAYLHNFNQSYYSQPLTIHATGTCTIAGTLSASVNTGADGNNGNSWGGGSGGGGGGGTAAGTAGNNNGNGSTAGSAGAASGGTGGNASAYDMRDVRLLVTGAPFTTTNYNLPYGGAKGGNGGSSGATGGYGGGGIVLDCQTINFTGTIDVSGQAGGAATANNTGAGGGGGGGFVIMRSQNLTNSGTINVSGGAGGSCGAYTGCGAGGNGENGWSEVLAH